MANYKPVAQNELLVLADTLLADETFANDRDKSDAKSHHLEKDRLGKHHLVSPLVAIKHPSIMRPTTPIASNVAVAQSNTIAAGHTAPVGPTNNGGVTGGGGGSKPNVTFKLSDESDKVLSVIETKLLFYLSLASSSLSKCDRFTLSMWAMVNVALP